MRHFVFCVLFSTTLLVASPALAEKPAHVQSKSQVHQKIRQDVHVNNGRVITKGERTLVRFGSDDRAVISSYLGQHYRTNCPPGLAKKNNGCLPPGQAKKYGIGH